jgi:hypothetical protein
MCYCAEPRPLFKRWRTWTLCLPSNTMHCELPDVATELQGCSQGVCRPVMQHTWRSIRLHCSLLEALRLEQSVLRWIASLGLIDPGDDEKPFSHILPRLSAGNLLAAIASTALLHRSASIGALHARPLTLQQRQSNISKFVTTHNACCIAAVMPCILEFAMFSLWRSVQYSSQSSA